MAKIIDIDDEAITEKLKDLKPLHKNLPPVGYIPIELSTQGKLGVPKTIHVRNFHTSELLDLSLFTEDMLPERVIAVLNALIYEDVNVGDWPDKAITELLIRIYVNFFTPIIPEARFPWNQEDIDYLKSKGRDADVDRLMKGVWKPTTVVDLRKVNIINISDKVKSFITIKKKRTDGSVFSAKFLSYPRYGDSLTVKKFIEETYEERDKAWADLKKRLELKDRMLSEYRDVALIPTITPKEYTEWQIYEAQKAVFISRVIQALNLVGYEDIDLSNTSLGDRLEYTSKPEFDSSADKKIEKHYDSLVFGLDPEVEIKNPITEATCTRRFSFRVVDIIQTLRQAEPDGYDIVYDD